MKGRKAGDRRIGMRAGRRVTGETERVPEAADRRIRVRPRHLQRRVSSRVYLRMFAHEIDAFFDRNCGRISYLLLVKSIRPLM